MHIKILTFLVAIIFFVSFEASANNPNEGYSYFDRSKEGKAYWSLNLEYAVSADTSTDISSSLSSFNIDYDHNGGLGIGTALGYYLTDSFRVEGEFAFHRAEVDTVNVLGFTDSVSGEDYQAYSLMGNVYYNFPTHDFMSLYVGGGLGYTFNEGFVDSNAIGVAGHEDGSFAYQLMTGIDFDVDRTKTFYTGYRYFATTGLKHTIHDPVFGAIGIETKHSQHIVEVGFRHSF